MTNQTTLDERRKNALDQVEKSERHVKYFMVAAALWEGLLLVIIVLFMDFSNALHVLILLSTGIVYGTLGIGLIALGAYIRQSTLRVLAAIEVQAEN